MDQVNFREIAHPMDTSKEACAARLRVAIASTELTQAEFARRVGKGAASITNQVVGDQFPSRDVMNYLFERYRIDYNFILAGQYAQLPLDVQDKLAESFAVAK